MAVKKSISIAIAGLALVAASASAYAYTGQRYAKEAKVTLTQAENLALKAFPGKIISVELEKEKGGSGLRFSFDIRNGKTVHEVGIDAETGKVLENSDDSGDSD